MSRSNGLLTGLTAALLLTGANASALTLAEYSFTSNSQASTDTVIEPNATDADFGSWDGNWSGSTLPAIGFNFNIAYVSSDLTNDVLTNGTGTGAIGHSDYLSFTIEGSGFDITSISFDHGINDSEASNSYEAHLFTSATGFAAANVLDTSTLAGTGGAVDGGVAFDATGTTLLQGVTSDLEIRIYFTDSQNVPGFFHSIDNIVVEGTPEPSSLAVLGVLGLFVISRRRRAA